MSPAPVPKPSNAGAGKAVIVDTKGSYVNVRSGPGTSYADIGDIRDKTIAKYYPESNQNGWVWIEQFSLGGWVATSVVTLNEVDVEPPKDYPPTPYDGGVAIWHWKGEAVPEDTIAEFISNVKANTPNVKHIFVKIGDGNAWQGEFDSGDMAVNGPDDVKRWIDALQAADLVFHGWIVMKGVDIAGEAKLISAVANVPGVASVIMDVEPYDGYWEVGAEPIRPLMTDIRQNVPDGFHIGLAIDPRRAHYKSVFPDEWYPFVDSVHTMSYWRTFRRSVSETMSETYEVWGGYGKPLIPILQGAAEVADQKEAVGLATTQYGAKALSWWRYGVIGQWDAVNIPLPEAEDGTTTPPDGEINLPPDTAIGKEVIIFAGQDGFRSGTFTDTASFTKFSGAYGWDVLYTPTEPESDSVWAEWKTSLPGDGTYQISVFIPARHSTTKKARYKIHGIKGTNTEVIVDINQSIHRNEWVPLGVFELVKNQENAGKVFLNNLTFEADKEVSFDAIRYRQILTVPKVEEPVTPEVAPDIPIADGFDAPVGTAAERAGEINTSSNYWFGEWRDATGFGRDTVPGYVQGQGAYHTGVDLNWKFGDADLGQPVYAAADGVVIFQSYFSIWGNVTVIRHDPLYTATGPVYYTRYAHMQNVKVKAGQRVKRGDQLGEVGKGDKNRWVAHLHYDIVRTTVLERLPNDWPRMDIERLLNDYVDPLTFTMNHRPKR